MYVTICIIQKTGISGYHNFVVAANWFYGK